MMATKKQEGDLVVRGSRFGIVITRWNSFVVENLLAGALDCLKRHGADENDIEVVYVPGAFEIPLVVKKMAASKKHDAIITLGAVIRGGTPHFEYVAGECVKGMASAMMQFEVPVAFGVLTVDTIEQAIERAGSKAGNKGFDAAMAAVEMANLYKAL